MPLAGELTQSSSEIRAEQVQVLGRRPAKYDDDAIVTLVRGDAARAAEFIAQTGLAEHWREAKLLYKSPRTQRAFEGTTVTRANVARFKVAQAVQTLVPGMKSGIFYEKPPFLFRPRPSQKESTVRAKMTLFDAFLDYCKFELKAEKAMESQVLYGTVICKAGWEKKTRIRKEYKRKRPPIEVQLPFEDKPKHLPTEEADEVTIQEVEETEEGPFFDVCKLGSVLVDPGWSEANELHTAKYVVHRTYPTFKDLEALRENDLYNIPSEEQLKAYFFEHRGQGAGETSSIEEQLHLNGEFEASQMPNEVTSVDPLEAPLEMLERWDEELCHAILSTAEGKSVIIRTGDHQLPRIPFFAANFWNEPEEGWGIGAGRIVGSDQRIDKGVTDAALDILSFACNPSYARDQGANVSTQQVKQRLGGIVDVQVRGNQSVRDVFGLIEMPKVPGEAFALLSLSSQTANAAVGSDEAFTQGSLPGRGGSSAARTATGAGGIISANAGRIQGPVGHFCNGILLPFLALLEDMVKEFAPTSLLRKILGERLGDYELDIEDFYNSTEEMETLAGTHLAAKKAMAQALPLMISVLENPRLIEQLNEIGYVVDVKELFEMFLETAEWKNDRDLIRPMTPQEQQAKQAQNPMMGKMQAAVQQLGAKHQFKAQEIDQQAQNKLAHDLFLNAGDEAANYVERGVAREAQRSGVYTSQPGG